MYSTIIHIATLQLPSFDAGLPKGAEMSGVVNFDERPGCVQKDRQL